MANTRSIHPQKFTLWLAMGSIIMMFVGFSSAYIVKQAAGNWLEFPLPNYFYFSTAVMVISSILLHLSLSAYKKQDEAKYKGFLVASTFFGITFIISQVLGFSNLYNMGVDIKANVSGSFFYLITFAHIVHVVGGIAALVNALIHAFGLKFEYKDFRKNRFELVVQYWHFVDLLWICILVFLLTNK